MLLETIINMIRLKHISLALALSPGLLFAAPQEGEPDKKDAKRYGDKYYNWHHADPKKDKKMGVGAWKAYSKLLADKKPKQKIIVAVIDGGVDYTHEDLKNVMWKNPGEIDGNGIDDDNNGYIDDIYGWNFLGAANGENVNEENLQYTRIFRNLDPKYKGKTKADIADGDHKEFDLYIEVKEKISTETEKYTKQLNQMNQMVAGIQAVDAVIEKELGKSDYTLEEVKAINSEDATVKQMKDAKIALMEQGVSLSNIEAGQKHYSKYVNFYLNPEFKGRENIIGDDPSDYNDRNYGNPNVKGPDPYHGTFVAGLIGAQRGNNIGIDGIANNVEIMALRAIPNGDEYDKDVALSIRYAVDNGAKVLNMSFGKMYSPYKAMVDDAIKYAESKGVLMVNAAGNDHANVDVDFHYPIDRYEGGQVKNMLTVGASSMDRKKDLPGVFSNYGKQHVDLFAPGVDIVSCAPESEYDKGNGTSYSSPITAGVAALVWSYYPELTAAQLKEILMASAVMKGKKKVKIPTDRGKTRDEVKFETLSVTGGVVNAYNALKLAEKVSQGKEIKKKY